MTALTEPELAYRQEVGRRLADARCAKKWTRERAAEVSGIHPRTICAYERAQCAVPIVALARLAGSYGRSPGSFLPDVVLRPATVEDLAAEATAAVERLAAVVAGR